MNATLTVALHYHGDWHDRYHMRFPLDNGDDLAAITERAQAAVREAVADYARSVLTGELARPTLERG